MNMVIVGLSVDVRENGVIEVFGTTPGGDSLRRAYLDYTAGEAVDLFLAELRGEDATHPLDAPFVEAVQ